MTDTHITEVGTVIVPVTDQDRAVEFYCGKLGFEKRLDGEFAPGERWIEVAPPGAATTIALVRMAEDDNARVSLATRDAEADHAELTERGVDAGDDLIRMGEYVPPMFAFRDPDGNTIRVVERP
jgi:catechol 2,3-dioxygenase-like lactoylglutathione lyase family enzyme